MKISNRIFNNPDAGTYRNRKAVLVLDSSSTSIPSNLMADSVSLRERDRILFTGISEDSQNNRIYKVDHGHLVLDADGLYPSGDSAPGELVYVMQGSHAGELWGYEDGSWEILDVDVDTSDDAGGGSSAASDVTYDNTTSGLSAENVQDALDELSASSVTPGGSDTNIQYNDNGSFAGSSALSWDTTNQSLSITGISGSAVYNLRIKGDYRQILFDHNYAGIDPNARSWGLVSNNPNSGEIALLSSVDDTSAPSERVWSLDNNHEMFMWQNNKWFYQRNSANNGFVGMMKIDNADGVVINNSSTNINLNGTIGNITLSADTSIKFQNGSEGFAGAIWTSNSSDGSGFWSFFNTKILTGDDSLTSENKKVLINYASADPFTLALPPGQEGMSFDFGTKAGVNSGASVTLIPDGSDTVDVVASGAINSIILGSTYNTSITFIGGVWYAV